MIYGNVKTSTNENRHDRGGWNEHIPVPVPAPIPVTVTVTVLNCTWAKINHMKIARSSNVNLFMNQQIINHRFKSDSN